MSGLHFVHRDFVHLLWGALLLAGMLLYLELRRGAQLGRFISPAMQLRLSRRLAPTRQGLRVLLVLGTLLFGIFALMRPQTPGDPETLSAGQVSADIMVVLDVSRSMLAEDAAPTRLQRAKAELSDLLGRLKGHRIGLAAFAGRAVVLCPLTPDYGFFRMILEGTNTRSVSRGGTRIGDGIRQALGAFGPGSAARLILLVTDGEDQDSYPLDAAREAKRAGVRIVSIGFGDERGSEITLVDPTTGARSYLTDRSGQLVRTRLDGKTLRDIALATDGAYVPAGVAALDLESIVREHIQPRVRERADTTVRTVPKEHYPWLLLLSLLSLCGAVLAGARPGGRTGLGVVLVLLCAGPVRAEDTPPRRGYNEARAAYEKGDVQQAESGFLGARDRAGADDELRYRAAFNLGLTYARKADRLMKDRPQDALQALTQGAAWFRDAVRARPEDQDARVNLEVLLRRVRQLADQLEKGEGGLSARLARVIQDERTLRDRIRALLSRIRQAGASSEPIAFQGEFDEGASFQRTLLADAGAILDLAGEQRDQLSHKAEAERTDEERGRLVQLENLEHYLNRARDVMADVGRLLRRLQGDRAHRQADAAVRELKRALEQLQDPVAVLKGLVADQTAVYGQTRVLGQLKNGELRMPVQGGGPQPAPPWFTAAVLAEEQKGLPPRALELLARLRAGVEHAAQGKGDHEQTKPAEARKRQRLIEAAHDAIPALEQASSAMERAQGEIGAEQFAAAETAQREALASLLRALERFSGIRDLIELAYGEQEQVVALLTPPAKGQKGPELSTRERATILRDSVARNRERIVRLKTLFADEVDALSAQEQSGPPSPGDQNEALQKLAAERERYRHAEEKRQATEAALGRLAAGLATPSAGARVPAEEARKNIEELRRLFFTIVEHLKELLRNQVETRDQTSSVQAQKDEEDKRRRIPSLAEVQDGHARLGLALGEALAAQADQAGAQAARQPQAQQAQKALSEAAEEVKKAHVTMAGAVQGLKEDAQAPVSPDLEPVLSQQKEAIAHLEKAIQILEPPQDQKKQPQDQQQKQDQQVSQEQAEQRLQAIREREAERQREQRRREPSPAEPVEKDW